MNEKHDPSLLGFDNPKPRSRCSKWKVLGLAGVAYVAWHALTMSSGPSHCGKHHHTYPGESIQWKPCGSIKDRPLECSNIDVPMDQFGKSPSDKTFNIPLIRLRGNSSATQNLLLNPGGPGGSGLEFIHRRGEQLSTIVGDGFHLLTFDPRGVNSSTPQALCYPDKKTRRRLSSVRTSNLIDDSAEIYAWTQNYVRACSDTMGEHGKYINTPQTAADMNSILDAVGQQDMYYWGFSYGTLLGQTYATLFPERSHRVIIDGVVNQFHWYGELVDPEDLSDTENVMKGFFKQCIKEGDSCGMSSLADSWEGLQTKFLHYMSDLKQQPLSVYVNNTIYGLLDHHSLWFGGLFMVLYKPQNWYNFADRVGKLMHGNGTEAFLDYAFDDSLENDDSFYTISINDGLSGPDNWPQDKDAVLNLTFPILNNSLFAEDDNGFYFAKQQWKIPQTHNYVPKKGVETAHPLLILSTTYDPVCPLVSARSARAAFEGSKLVEVKGYGHCSVAVPSLCLAKHVREFLYHGSLPSEDTKCEVDGPYFVNPETKEEALAQALFEDQEEQAIHMAQLQLARDPDWPSYRRRW